METASPREVGIDPRRLDRLFEVIEQKVSEKLLFGGSFLVARHGKIVAARGVGRSEPGKKRAARPDDIYCLFSTTKPITATILLMKIDQGLVQLSDRVCDWIPGFEANGKERVTVAHVLTHTGGFPNLPPDWGMPSWADWDATIARLCAMPIDYEPGAAVCYHALTQSWIQAEIARRAEGSKRSFAEMCTQDLYGPLKMKDAHMGVRPDMRERRVPIQALDHGGVPFPIEFLEMFNAPEAQGAAIPGGGSHGTVFDLARFYQMWLNKGELDGVRILSPAMCELATTIHTGELPDRFFDILWVPNRWPIVPANRGFGFWVHGRNVFAPSVFGSLSSPRAFGHPGASSIMAWADPERDLVFVGLNAGLIEESRHIRRMNLFSDLASACVVD
jgi:CubicO group peptidase (beta-lactamase class C family)